MIDSLGSELSLLKSRVREEYFQNHKMDEICTFVSKNGKKENFKWITNVMKLSKYNLVSNNIIMHDFLQKIFRDEMDYLLENIKNNAKTVESKGNELESICQNIGTYFDNNTPTTIIIPKKLREKIPDWNRELRPSIVDPPSDRLQLGDLGNLKVIIPQRGVEFNDIIITNRIGNVLNFIPDKTTNSRIHIGHEKNPDTVSFYIHAWYFYEKRNLECNLVIKRNNI